MTHVAFYLDTHSVSKVDLEKIDLGNPGIGGTEYMFFLIASHLAKNHRVTLYVTEGGNYPSSIHYKQVQNASDAVKQAESDNIDVMIFRESEMMNIKATLQSSSLKVIMWAHNYSSPKVLKSCLKTVNIKRYICVSREQMEQLRDHGIFKKTGYIYNTLVTGAFPSASLSKKGNTVFYMGSLIKDKGFHILARHWDEIVSHVPDAVLHVIGSGKLYNRDSHLGPLGIASAEYEALLSRYVLRGGHIRSDIVFHGILGPEKIDLMKTAKVAVVNPSGEGETFCITALEFGLMGVPVVTKNVGGPRNVVANGLTGFLYEKESELAHYVIKLLKDDLLCEKMGDAARLFLVKHFDIQPIITRWEETIRQVHENRPFFPDLTLSPHSNSIKKLKEANRRLKQIPFLAWLPSVDGFIRFFKKKANSLFIKPLRKLKVLW